MEPRFGTPRYEGVREVQSIVGSLCDGRERSDGAVQGGALHHGGALHRGRSKMGGGGGQDKRVVNVHREIEVLRRFGMAAQQNQRHIVGACRGLWGVV